MAFVLTVGQLVIGNIENKKNRNNRLEKLIGMLEKNVREYPNAFLEMANIKIYQQFIDETPSVIPAKSIAPVILIRLILEKNRLPTISRVVDAMNLISIEKALTISIWDRDKVQGMVHYRMSIGGEKYWPFMGDEVVLLPGELAAFDDEKVLCLVRYRDSKYAPVTTETKNIIVHIQGVNDIQQEKITGALDELEKLLLENVGGTTQEKRIDQQLFS